MSNDLRKIPTTTTQAPISGSDKPIQDAPKTRIGDTADLQKVWFTNPVQFGTTSKQRHWLSTESSGATMSARLEEHVKSLTLVGSLQCVLVVMRDDAKVDAKREFLIPLSVISHMLVKQ